MALPPILTSLSIISSESVCPTFLIIVINTVQSTIFDPFSEDNNDKHLEQSMSMGESTNTQMGMVGETGQD